MRDLMPQLLAVAQQSDVDIDARSAHSKSSSSITSSATRKHLARLEQFLLKVSDVNALLADMETKLAEMESAHDAMLNAISSANQSRQQRALMDIDTSFSTLANTVRGSLKALEAEARQDEDRPHKGVEDTVRIRKTQHASVTRHFLSVIARYNDVQATLRRRHRDAFKTKCLVIDPAIDDATVDHILDSGCESVFTGQRLADMENLLADVQDRHVMILALERSLRELHELFMDVSMMIVQQGEMLGRIEDNVTQAADYSARAAKHVWWARLYKKSARSKKFAIFGVLVAIIGILVGVPLLKLGII